MLKKSIQLAGVAAILLAGCASAHPVRDGERLRVGQTQFRVQSPEGADAITILDKDTVRFEVKPGDQWARDKQHGSGAERAELSAQRKVRMGESTTVSFKMRIVSGVPTARRAIGLAQLHGPNRPDLPPGKIFGRPPFFLLQTPDGVVLQVGSGSTDRGEDERRTLVTLPADVGNWNNYRFDITLGGPETGRLVAWRNGEEVVNYTGPVGYDVGSSKHYWKFGIYQYRGIPEPSIVEFSGLDIDDGGVDLVHLNGNNER